jgi:hypothetical protein
MKKIVATVSALTLLAFAKMPVFAQNLNVTQPPGLQIDDLGKFISALVGLVFIVAGILVFVFLVWGGIQWMTSGGDKQATEAARNRITAALVGLAIIAVSWALTAIIGKFFGFSLTNITVPTPY